MKTISAPLFQAHLVDCRLHSGRVSAAGASEAVKFSEAPGRVYLSARAELRSGRQIRPSQPTLTLVVEDSADGATWATLATFEFEGNDPQNATVAPRAYMRVAWTIESGEWDISLEAVSIAAASNGGSLPSEWTVGADGELTIDSPATTGRILKIEAAAGHNDSPIFEVLHGTVPQLQLYADGGFDVNVIGLGYGTGTEQPTGALLGITAFPGQTGDLINGGDPVGNALFRVLPGGAVVTSQHAAPADDDLLAGQMAVWFDQTDGAAKLMVKSKTADGTVAVGELALT